MRSKSYDFSGWATKNDIRCSDGRTIRKDAFVDNDGMRVPLVYNHVHSDPFTILGHADLENRPEGVYMYGSFNDTPEAQHFKEAVRHGDITRLSIYANHLKQNGGDVVHGQIREVSLVIGGANPGAVIDSVILHGDGMDEEAIISFDEPIDIFHSDEEPVEDIKEEKVEEKVEENNDSKEEDEEMGEISHADNNKTVKDVLDTLNEEQKIAVSYVIGQLTGDSDDEGEENMKHNVFDDDEMIQDNVLSHSDMEAIFDDARRTGSLKDAVLAHTDGYGITNIDYLFPEAKTLNPTPEFIKRDDDWVGIFMNGVHKSPFSRIKSIFANITEDEARAKGYIKGNLKKEEVFSLLKRSTTPQTVYKKQKLDRDDIVDIVDLDVVAYIKQEMRMMLNEEIARAALVGDGRLNSDDDKISEDHIRPIYKDADLYTIKVTANVASSASPEVKAAAFIKAAIRSRKNYKGSGNPMLFTTEDMLTEMLLLEDGVGRTLYNDVNALATKLRVSRIVTVPVMDNITDETRGKLEGIILNLNDYNIGADKGGAVNMFDDFDIDYNQMKYLIETRCSGALTKPFSAMAIFVKEGTAGPDTVTNMADAIAAAYPQAPETSNDDEDDDDIDG